MAAVNAHFCILKKLSSTAFWRKQTAQSLLRTHTPQTDLCPVDLTSVRFVKRTVERWRRRTLSHPPSSYRNLGMHYLCPTPNRGTCGSDNTPIDTLARGEHQDEGRKACGIERLSERTAGKFFSLESSFCFHFCASSCALLLSSSEERLTVSEPQSVSQTNSHRLRQ